MIIYLTFAGVINAEKLLFHLMVYFKINRLQTFLKRFA